MSTFDKTVNGWRYVVQRSHVRGESPTYSLMVAKPREQFLRIGIDASDAIRPVKDDSTGTKASVIQVICRHQQYVANRART